MAQPSWIGRTLNGRYEIQELLGQGGMAAVYKAFDHNLKRVVAVKLIHSQFSSNEDFVRRFESEAATVAQLRHPNIIQIFDFTHEDEIYFIVFEFVPGETLQARMKRLAMANRQMEIKEAVDIAAKTADALNYAHTKGLIHRDIKPANIMLNVYGEPIVMDFGIAKIMGGTQHTATGAVLGTARYMSPEQIKGDRIDPRSDEYSLGVTLFEMLGGRPPFEADSAMTLMMMHMTDPVPDLRNLRAEVPSGLVSVVNKSLAKNRDDRYATAAAMAAALRHYDAETTSAAGATTIEQSPVNDPGKTVLESAALGAAVAASPSSAATVVESTAASQPAAAPPPPRTPPAGQPAAGKSGPNWLLIGGAIMAVIAILAIAYFVFIRPSGGNGEGTPPIAEVTEEPVATEPSATEVIPTEEPAATEIPATNTAEPEPTDEPPVDSGAAVDSVVGDVIIVNADGETAVSPDTPITAGSKIVTGSGGEISLFLDDGSLIGLTENSELGIVEFATDPQDETQSSIFQMDTGNLLLSKTEVGNILEVLNSGERPLASLQFLAPVNAAGTTTHQSKVLQQSLQPNYMGINVAEDGSTLISCFLGDCTVFDDQTPLSSGSEIRIDANGQVNPPLPITQQSEGYQYWQTACGNCLPEIVPPTLPPTATSLPATATLPPPTTPPEPTAEPTTETTELSVRITGISEQNGTYVVNYETYGYTEQLPGQHVHFYFDTVSEANAGAPGSGPWKLYGGPRPFTQYTVNDRPSAATAMCARVANADHSIISGSGNCWALP